MGAISLLNNEDIAKLAAQMTLTWRMIFDQEEIVRWITNCRKTSTPPIKNESVDHLIRSRQHVGRNRDARLWIELHSLLKALAAAND